MASRKGVEEKLIIEIGKGIVSSKLNVLDSSDKQMVILCLVQKAVGRVNIDWYSIKKKMGFGCRVKTAALQKRYSRAIDQIRKDDEQH